MSTKKMYEPGYRIPEAFAREIRAMAKGESKGIVVERQIDLSGLDFTEGIETDCREVEAVQRRHYRLPPPGTKQLMDPCGYQPAKIASAYCTRLCSFFRGHHEDQQIVLCARPSTRCSDEDGCEK